MSFPRSPTSDATDSESNSLSSSSSYSGSPSGEESPQQQPSKSTQLEKAATCVCTEWSPKSLVTDSKDKYELLSETSMDISSLMFDEMRQREEKLLWLRNEAFKFYYVHGRNGQNGSQLIIVDCTKNLK